MVYDTIRLGVDVLPDSILPSKVLDHATLYATTGLAASITPTKFKTDSVLLNIKNIGKNKVSATVNSDLTW